MTLISMSTKQTALFVAPTDQAGAATAVPEPAEPAAEMADTATTDSSQQQEKETFRDLGVDPRICDALAKVGITHPFPIQALTLPTALQGHDIIGQAKTGTGKTLGFGIPLIQKILAPGEPGFDSLPAPGKPQGLVVLPTRELAVQVARDLRTATGERPIRVIELYGGRAYEPQIATLTDGVEIVVGTPGRMIDLLRQHYLDLSHATTVVLDEADEMLDLGFLPDVETLLAATPAHRHTMLFSATMPGAVVAMARRYMTQATHIRAQDPEDSKATVRNIKQFIYRCHALNKVEVLARILQANGRGRTIVFTRTKRTAARVAEDLTDRGFAAASLHGDLGQGAREQALRAFRKGKVDVLVATDVAARGINVDDVTHVINYQCPEDEKIYLHRTGRTGRAGHQGTAVTFVDWDDVPRWSMIDRQLEIGQPEPRETYSTSPHLYEDLDIPEGVTGTLPRSKRVLAGLDAEAVEDLGETGHRGGGSRGSGRDRGGRGHGSARGGRSHHGGRGGSGGDRDRGSVPRSEAPRQSQGGSGQSRPRRRTRVNRPTD
ncbi:MAG: DEAD/DEAH box helicase [Bifidobacteriaceae bacterium]|nr:DEAD/DEAH box helicase [Bifidobacteriaceae bacterium]